MLRRNKGGRAMKTRLSHGILAGIVMSAAGAAAAQAAAQMATNAPDKEYCYGIAKAGENNCANSKHGCATLAQGDYNGQDFKEVAKGTCESMNGATKPFKGKNPKVKAAPK